MKLSLCYFEAGCYKAGHGFHATNHYIVECPKLLSIDNASFADIICYPLQCWILLFLGDLH